MPVDLLFPRRCLDCGQWGNYFCSTCLEKIKPLKKQICPVCGRAAISGKTHARCQTSYSLNGLISFFPYQGAIKKAISKLKYQFVTDLAKELIDLVSLPLFKTGVLVPVPLHSRRERWRGFNQAELLGELLAQKFGWQFKPDLLVRHRFTQPQVKLKKEARKKNVSQAFGIKKGTRLPRVSIILFDDVWTTGSTLKEAGQRLKKAGLKEIWGLTLAR